MATTSATPPCVTSRSSPWPPPLAISAEWTLTDSEGDEAASGPVPVPAGERGTTFRVDPLGEGFSLDDGRYTLSVDASAAFDDQPVEGSFEYDDPIVVDNTPPTPTDPKMSAKTFYPAAQRGQPRTVTGTIAVPGDTNVHVDIVDSDGNVIRSVDLGSAEHGAAQYRWTGARGNGKLARAGRYRMVWAAVDRAGNPSEPIKARGRRCRTSAWRPEVFAG
jgi:FlgD Ig-like domain